MGFSIKAIKLFGAIRRSMYQDSSPKGKVIIAKNEMDPAGIILITGNMDYSSVIYLNTDSQVFLDEPICFNASGLIGWLSVVAENNVKCSMSAKRVTFVDESNKKNKSSAPLFADKWDVASVVNRYAEIDKKEDFVVSLSHDDWNRLRITANFAAAPEKINWHSVQVSVKNKSVGMMATDGFMMAWMWADGVATGSSSPFLVQPRTIDFQAFDKTIMYKHGNLVFIEHGNEVRVSKTVAGSFPAEPVRKALSDDSIVWHINADAAKLTERISAVGQVDYQKLPSQIRVRSLDTEIAVESVFSLAPEGVSLTMTNNIESDLFSFVLASKYAQKALGYLKSASLNNEDVSIGESGEATIVFASLDSPGRFGFARIHDADEEKPSKPSE